MGKKAQNIRDLALQIAIHGEESAASSADVEKVKKARDYLTDLATTDGRLALGKTFLILSDVIERSIDEGKDKTLLEAVKKYAELAKLADFSEIDVEARAEKARDEQIALQYLESTGVIPKGLELTEAARRIAQYIVDEKLIVDADPNTVKTPE